MFLDFTKTGWKAAAVKFVKDAFKTMLAAGIAYAITQLGQLHLATPELGLLVVAVRATLSALLTWLTASQTPETVVG